MKVQAISQTDLGHHQNKKLDSNKKVTTPNFASQPGLRTIAFKGDQWNHVIFIGAEIKKWQQKGGVATVLFDYANQPGIESAIVLPYNNGLLTYDSKGQFTGQVSAHQFPEGHPLAGQHFATSVNLDKVDIHEVYNDPKKYVLLDEVKKMDAPWDKSVKTALYKVRTKGSLGGINKDIFFVYTPSQAVMKEPYAEGSYASKDPAKILQEANTKAFEPTAYAEFDRMAVEYLDDVVANTTTSDGSKFSPRTVSCSDSQTSYVPYFMRAKNIQDILPIYTLHNGGDGYTGQTSGRLMFQNLLIAFDEAERTKHINNLLSNHEFVKNLVHGTDNEFFKKYMPQLVDASGSFNPTLIPFMYALKDDGYVKGVNTVSKGYAEGLAYNPNIQSGLREFWLSLYKDGQAIGILNALDDPSLSGMEGKGKGYLPGYETPLTIKYSDGTEETIAPFKRFQEAFFKDESGNVKIDERTLKHVDETILDNQINFLRRFSGKYDADDFAGIGVKPDGKELKGAALRNFLLNGLDNRDVSLIGHISDEMIQKFVDAKEGKPGAKRPKVFVSWGRLDDQKAEDSVMRAFKKYIKEDPNAILVLGGPPLEDANGNAAPCTEKTLAIARKMAEDPELKGKFVFMPAFAPGKVLSGIADAAVFPSRFAPCELTDLESMKYFLRVIASNCQGLADKNFDETFPGESSRATGYKTIHEFFGITQSTIEGSTEDVVKLFMEGDSIEGIPGFAKLYRDAEAEFLAHTGSSNISYRNAIAKNLKDELSGILSETALTQQDTEINRLVLTTDESAKLSGLGTSKQEKELFSKFAQNKKLNAKEVEQLTALLNTSSLEAGEKTRFIELLNGTTQRQVEAKLLEALFNPQNLADKNLKLTGPAVSEADMRIITAYLADPTQANFKSAFEGLVTRGSVDLSQLNAAKRIYNYDPVINYIHETAKYSDKYKNLIARCRNEIMENELFDCMKRCANETPETRLKMLRNHFYMNTKWDGNAELTGMAKVYGSTEKASSQDLYNDFYKRVRTEEQKKKPFNNFIQKLLDTIAPKRTNNGATTTQNIVNDAVNAAEDAGKKAGGMSKGLKIALGIGAGLLAIGGGYYMMSKDKTKSNADGDTFRASNPAQKPNSPAQQPAAQQPAKANPAQQNNNLNPYLTTK